jgi:hypothetical protein
MEPAFRTPGRPSKLDPFADKPSAWLKTEAGKSRKTRRTLKQLHADLVASGHTGSHNRVAAFTRMWKAGRQRQALMPTPPAFDGFVEQSKRVSPTCLISFERTRYSVPASFANRPVSLRIHPDRLVVAAEGQIVREHPRLIQRSHKLPPRVLHDWRHCLAPRHCLRTNGGQWLVAAQAWCPAQWRSIRRAA